MSLPYYKKYPRDFIEGTIGLSLELKGAYSLVLDLIYMQDGKLPDDPRYISGLLGCTVRKWNSIREELLSLNKIYVSGEFISNYRADNERETLRKYQENQAQKRLGCNKNKGLDKTTVSPARVKPEPEPKKKNKQKGFDEFYETYGKKVDRKQALEVWCRKGLHTQAEDITKAAKQYSGSREAKYRKSPFRWLRDENWADEEPELKHEQTYGEFEASQILMVGSPEWEEKQKQLMGVG